MIARMDRIEILCLRAALPEVVAFLQEQGVVHLEEVPLAVAHHAGFLHRVHLLDEQKTEIEELESLERMLAEITPLLNRAPSLTQRQAAAAALEGEALETWRRKARAWSRDLRSMARRKANVRDNIEVLRNHRETLIAIAPLLAPEVVLGKNARVFVVRADAAEFLSRLKKRLLEQLGPGARIWRQESGKNAVVSAVTYPEEHDDAVQNILHDEGIAPVELLDRTLRGLALGEVLRRLDERIAHQQTTLTEFEGELSRFSDTWGAELVSLKSIVADRQARLQTLTRFAQSDMVAVIHGWIPHANFKPFSAHLEQRFPSRVLLSPLPVSGVDQKRIPILLQNNRIFEPFEVLLSLFKPPRYGTMDPSAMVGVFFVLFYGFILGDVVYGACVLLFAGLLRRKWGHIKPVRSASTVGFYAGASAIVFGILYGEYCGDLGEHFLGLQPLWLHRAHETLLLLEIAIYVGCAHMILSLALGIWANVRFGHVKAGMERLGMLLGLLAIGLFVAGVMEIGPIGSSHHYYAAGAALLVGAAIVLFWFTGWFAAIHLIEIISLVGSVMSYSRLMAVGMASVALADVANNLGELVPNPILGIPLAILIHLLNVTLGMFSPTVHSLRLNYVEFLPKFYFPEGRAYQPFKKEALW